MKVTKVFLSHSSADNILAKRIYRELRDQAVSVWFDRIELKPGDSLTSKIPQGIGNADALLVLVTESSKSSRWVEKEISIALAMEMSQNRPHVIPLLLKGCELPAQLVDKIYINIDHEGRGTADIIPAIFRDSYILDIVLCPQSLDLDHKSLKEDLYEYSRSNNKDVRIRIANHDFNQKVIETAEKTIPLVNPDGFKQQIKRRLDDLPIALSMFWTNLSAVLSTLVQEIFSAHGKSLSTLNDTIKSIRNTLEYSFYQLYRYLHVAVFSSYAEQFGFRDLASFLKKYEDYERYNEEEVICKLFEFQPDTQLIEAGLEGSKDKGVNDARVYLSGLTESDRLILQLTCRPKEIILSYSWYTYYLPQILGRFIAETSFGHARPIHESEGQVGFSMDDFERIGLP